MQRRTADPLIIVASGRRCDYRGSDPGAHDLPRHPRIWRWFVDAGNRRFPVRLPTAMQPESSLTFLRHRRGSLAHRLAVWPDARRESAACAAGTAFLQ